MKRPRNWRWLLRGWVVMFEDSVHAWGFENMEGSKLSKRALGVGVIVADSWVMVRVMVCLSLVGGKQTKSSQAW